MSNHSPDPTPALVMPPAGQGSWPRLGADHWDVADPIAMSKNETLKDYLRRARKDATFRAHLLENARSVRSFNGWAVGAAPAHLLENARSVRSFNGWAALVFAVLAIGPSVYNMLRGGVWLERTPGVCAVGCLIGVLTFQRFGDRIAMLSSLDDMPNHSSDPTPSSVPPVAGQPTRQP